MKTIWKYLLTFDREQIIYMPQYHIPLCVGNQHNRPELWCLVDTESPVLPTKVLCFNTGGIIPDTPLLYLGTWIDLGGDFVHHYFIKTD